MAKKKSAKKEKPKVNKDLDGFDIQINSFGEIVTSYDLDKINNFLDKNVDDKKLREREDMPGSNTPPLKNKKQKEEED